MIHNTNQADRTMEFDLDRFDHLGNELYAWASDLGIPPGRIPREIRVRSSSGRLVRYIITRTETREGDVLGWTYEIHGLDSCLRSARTVTIHND